MGVLLLKSKKVFVRACFHRGARHFENGGQRCRTRGERAIFQSASVWQDLPLCARIQRSCLCEEKKKKKKGGGGEFLVVLTFLGRHDSTA
jgi:hypothetical protein